MPLCDACQLQKPNENNNKQRKIDEQQIKYWRKCRKWAIIFPFWMRGSIVTFCASVCLRVCVCECSLRSLNNKFPAYNLVRRELCAIPYVVEGGENPSQRSSATKPQLNISNNNIVVRILLTIHTRYMYVHI